MNLGVLPNLLPSQLPHLQKSIRVRRITAKATISVWRILTSVSREEIRIFDLADARRDL
jgi:hypothetical protein